MRRWHRVAISALVLAVLLLFIPLGGLAAAMRQAPPGLLAGALVAFLACHVTAALKWRMLQGANAGVPLLATLRAHFAGVVANLWLPGVVGGDLVRVGVVYRQSYRPTAVALASLVDRVIDSAALLTLALVGLLMIGGPAEEARRALVAALVVLLVGVVALVGAYAVLRRRLQGERAAQLQDAITLLLARPLAVVGAFVLSAAVQSGFILANIQLGRALGVHVSTAVWFMAWPLSKLAALVPISAAGIGVREAAIVVLMRPFDAPADAVMASSLLWQALLFTGGFLGWGLLSLVSHAPHGQGALQSSRE